MGRVSQAQAKENRRRITETASRLFRELGTHVSVADLMKASGLTHGGGCKQIEHGDIAATGCPAAALAIDMAREPGNRETRRVYTEGVSGLAEWLATEGQDDIARPCTTLGALVLARATKGSPLSEEILTTARSAVTATSRDARIAITGRDSSPA
ncbi:TetR/AcrR family transcriptional regulator [Streptomyces avermitilis]|uniref:TetR/AcrR family transcriptional regulator n=1 Tax=Streptomyces avermitilis TaxID=33903 RepID=UPI00381E2A2C